MFHVPPAQAVICGDVTYSDVHMKMCEAEAKRQEWIASIDKIAAPTQTVISGHKGAGNPDPPADLELSKQYLRDFTETQGAAAQPRTPRGNA